MPRHPSTQNRKESDSDPVKQHVLRCRSDFPYYAKNNLRIRTKAGSVLPLSLNREQRYIHYYLERQKQITGMVRALILKGRQQGCSTYTEGRFYWITTKSRGFRTFILTHEKDATQNVFEMAQRFHNHCPPIFQIPTISSNRKELDFEGMDAGYRIGTAGNTETGRSGTIQLFHGSEVAFWPNADMHFRGAVQTVPDQLGTEIILESTSNGPQGVFYRMCMEAVQGIGQYQLIFIPWFWHESYRKKVPKGYLISEENKQYAKLFKLDEEQSYWREQKIIELGGLNNFRREYPSTVEEAFKIEIEGAIWTREAINTNRILSTANVPQLQRIVVSIDPAVTSKQSSDRCGIVVAGLDANENGYLLEDLTGRFTPRVWATRAVEAYYRWGADTIVAEVNNGGDLVKEMIRNIDSKVPVKTVSASRGKHVRAEPVASIYTGVDRKIYHVGYYNDIEDQMCMMTPNGYMGEDSPDNLDALVWAFHELIVQFTPAPIPSFRRL